MGAICKPSAGVDAREWAAYIDSWVFLGVTRREVVHELRTGEPREDRLPERDLDVGDVRSREDILAGDGHDLRVRVTSALGSWAS